MPTAHSPTPFMEFDPRHPAFRVNPYPFYELLRANAPLYYWDGWGVWFITRYDDCNRLLRDNRLGHGEFVGEAPSSQQALWEMQSRWLLFKNPPDHGRLRSLVHKAFTPRRVSQMRSEIQRLTDALLDKVAGQGEMDLIADLAYPLPVTVIAQMLGVPAVDHDRFHLWSDALGRSLDLIEETAVYDQASLAAEAFTDYIAHLVTRRRAEPQDDLLSALVAVEEAGQKLTEEELYATCTLLLTAGHETTINLIGNGALALLRNPDQLQLLRDRPELMPAAVEEFLRYDSPVQATGRLVLEEIEIRGQTLARGQYINFVLGAANRDPDQFSNPEKVDITRSPNYHLAFGSGIHYCLGAPLARLEAQIAFTTLLRRLPNLHLLDEDPPYRDNYLLRGLGALQVGFDQVRG